MTDAQQHADDWDAYCEHEADACPHCGCVTRTFFESEHVREWLCSECREPLHGRK